MDKADFRGLAIDVLDAVERDGLAFTTVLEQVHKEAIREALRESKGNRAHAAKALGIQRTTFQMQMRKFGIHLEEEFRRVV